MSQPQTHLTNLLHQWCEGSQEAAAELVRHYAPILRMVIKLKLEHYPCLRGVCDTDDVLQDAWKSFFRLAVTLSLEDVNNDAKLTAFLQEVARHKASRTVRTYVNTAKRDVRRQVSLEAIASRLAGKADRNLDPARRMEQIDQITQSLAQLSPEEQQILRWRMAGWTLEELAEECHCSLTNMSRTLCKLLGRVAELTTAASTVSS